MWVRGRKQNGATNTSYSYLTVDKIACNNNRQPINHSIYDAHEYFNRYWNLMSEFNVLRSRPWSAISDRLPPQVLVSTTTTN